MKRVWLAFYTIQFEDFRVDGGNEKVGFHLKVDPAHQLNSQAGNFDFSWSELSCSYYALWSIPLKLEVTKPVETRSVHAVSIVLKSLKRGRSLVFTSPVHAAQIRSRGRWRGAVGYYFEECELSLTFRGLCSFW
jgi:hypothetical protein